MLQRKDIDMDSFLTPPPLERADGEVRSSHCPISAAKILRHLWPPPAVQENLVLKIFLITTLSINISVNRPHPRMLRPCFTTRMQFLTLLGHSLRAARVWKRQQIARTNLRPGMHHQVRVMFSDLRRHAKIDTQVQPDVLMVIHRKGPGMSCPGKRRSSLSII